MERRLASPDYSTDPQAQELDKAIGRIAGSIGLEEAILYYRYPIFRTELDEAIAPDILVLARNLGLVFLVIDRGSGSFNDIADELDTKIFGRLINSPILKSGRRDLKVHVSPVIFSRDADTETDTRGIPIFGDEASLREHLQAKKCSLLDEQTWVELLAYIEGAKAIRRAPTRDEDDLPAESRARYLAQIERNIASFDREQRLAAISLVDGPQRIRGLAGSGKTIVLAMKAAQLHLADRDRLILFTFWTKSLYDIIRHLITRFYRISDNRDPDWDRLQVLHAWGGRAYEGVYYNACVHAGVQPLPFGAVPGGQRDKFGYVCHRLLQTGKIDQKYDYVIIDEGQDFSDPFYRLCFDLARGGKYDRRIIWAYDELQTIMDPDVQNVHKTFGEYNDKTPRIDLDRAYQNAPDQASRDVVLKKCYRNPLEILMVAHALGFGIYAKHGPVQMLESQQHWEELGYEIESGECTPGSKVTIKRPRHNSPLDVAQFVGKDDVLRAESFSEFSGEVEWIAADIRKFLGEGFKPQDILVICLDDQNSRAYFGEIARALSNTDAKINNIVHTRSGVPEFFIDGHITMSTVYKSKGNEAPVVYACGVDALSSHLKTRKGRNKVFTALTRAKAWARVSGVQPAATPIVEEVRSALRNSPYFEFEYPDPRDIDVIERDRSERLAKLEQVQELISELDMWDIDPSEIQDLVQSKTQKKGV